MTIIIPITQEHVPSLFDLLKTNKTYYRHMHESPTLKKTYRMLTALPPGAQPENKRNEGIIHEGKLIGFVETIAHYPEHNTGMIGLLIIEQTHQCKGIGSLLLKHVLEGFESQGITNVFLSYARTNEQSRLFWEKNGFSPNGDVDQFDDIDLVAMEKSL
ncbi:ATP-dependent helicase hrpA [Halomonadaceae bacterium LMG 33818]|uniref:GNAT family N-acetyltransferase n=1 Tax=Cernens ardua TaxID=3402176 RepID=UPI003EDC1D7C